MRTHHGLAGLEIFPKAPILRRRLFSGALIPLFAVLVATTGQGVEEEVPTESDRLQGDWQGKGAGGECSITIKGDSLHYRTASAWYKTTFTLTADTEPQQLRATIKDCGPDKSSVGKVVFVVYKFEKETLTLTTYDQAEEPPKTFEGNNLYVVRKVAPKTTEKSDHED